MTAIDIVRAHYAASERGDLAGMLAPLAPDVSWTEAAGFPYAGTYIGPEAVAENVFARIQADWEDFTLAVDELIDAGDTVVGLGVYSATHRVNRSSFRARVAHVWRVSGDRVVAFEQIVDTEPVHRALRGEG